MDTDSLIIKPLSKRKDRTKTGTLNNINLPAIIAELKHNQTFDNTGIKTKILLKSPEKKILLTALHEDTEIESFQANNSITFQVIEGNVCLNTSYNSVNLRKGQLFTLFEYTNYKFITKEETVMLITITGRALQNVNNKRVKPIHEHCQLMAE